MIPPLATARTTAREVQLRGVPVPIQRSGRDVSAARAFDGTGTAAVAAGAVSTAARATQSMRRTGCRIGWLQIGEPRDYGELGRWPAWISLSCSRPTLPPECIAEQALAAEAAGASELWLWEDCFLTGGIATAATALAATQRIVVGIGILPAPVRNAAFAAMELATLARLHPGRLHAGFGHGTAEWMRQVGAKPASQLTLLEEVTVAVRALLRGETVNTEGRYVRLRDVALDHPPERVPRSRSACAARSRCACPDAAPTGRSSTIPPAGRRRRRARHHRRGPVRGRPRRRAPAHRVRRARRRP